MNNSYLLPVRAWRDSEWNAEVLMKLRYAEHRLRLHEIQRTLLVEKKREIEVIFLQILYPHFFKICRTAGAVNRILASAAI